MLLSAGVEVAEALFSKAHSCFAPSIWRRLLMQALACAVVRACTKLGIAIAAKRPMMATTIMISIRVKPFLLEELIFIRLLCSFFARCERSKGGLLFYYYERSLTN